MDEVKKDAVDMPEKFQLSIQQRRQRILGVFFILFFVGIAGRLFWIQVVSNEDYTKKAVSQRFDYEKLGIDRGGIFDRNMIPLTDRKLRKYIKLNKFVNTKEISLDTIAKAAGVTKEEIVNIIDNIEETVEIKAKDFKNPYLEMLEKSRVNGVKVIEKKERYSDDTLARHVIGYIGKSDLKGKMGIEKSMDGILKLGRADIIATIVGSTKTTIPGLGVRKITPKSDDETYALNLTLDYHIQKIVEDVLDTNRVIGSTIVMEVNSGDILAMASTPNYDQNNIGKYLDSENKELVNKAIGQYDLGSIFKTIVAAAAIENNVIDPNEKFVCEGEIEVNNSIVKCATYSTHEDKEMSFQEAFGYSCNTTFVKVGMKVGAQKILEMARRMGFGEKQCNELLEEKTGNVPSAQDEGIGNISIGQGKIQVTPLQVTTMMNAIASNGLKYNPSIIDKVTIASKTGTTESKYQRGEAQPVLKPAVVNQLKEMLHHVTVAGTGKQAAMEEFGGSSGKTSSAETGIQSGEIIHGWFSGFVPADYPRYTITVFVYNGKSGGKAAAPLFKEIATRIFTEYKPLK